MRELWHRLGRINQVSLIIVALVVVATMVMLIVVTAVAGLIITVATVALTAFCFWFFFHDEVRSNRLRERDQTCEATILEVSETGVTVQGNYPQAKLRLRVEPAGWEPYEATSKCLLNRFEIPAYQPGSRVVALVDPKDRKKVAVA
jgi:hypothetical protein